MEAFSEVRGAGHAGLEYSQRFTTAGAALRNATQEIFSLDSLRVREPQLRNLLGQTHTRAWNEAGLNNSKQE